MTLAWIPVLALFVPAVAKTPVHVAAGVVAVLFAPGYALVAALYPDRKRGSPTDRLPDPLNTDALERVAMAVGLSVALTPLASLVLDFTPWQLNPFPVLVTLAALTSVVALVAIGRRVALTPEDRFAFSVRRAVSNVRSWVFVTPDTRTDVALNAMLVVGLLLTVSAVGYATVTVEPGESFTEFSLMTRTEGGEFMADDYPDTFVAGETKPVVVGIGNHEGESRQYTVVVELQRVTDNGTTVVETQRLQRFQTRVADDRTVRSRVSLTPRMTGENLRLAFLLYRGAPPENPTVENAYRENHLWVEVNQS